MDETEKEIHELKEKIQQLENQTETIKKQEPRNKAITNILWVLFAIFIIATLICLVNLQSNIRQFLTYGLTAICLCPSFIDYINQKFSKNIKWYVQIVASAIIIMVGMSLFGYAEETNSNVNTLNLNNIYLKYEENYGFYMEIGNDGSYLSIDTNPINIDDYSSSTAHTLIQLVHTDLNLPDSLLTKMEQTRAIDGTQTQTYDNVTVTWNYHPDNGLEIIYEITDN